MDNGLREAGEKLYFNPEIETMPRAEIERLQWDRLQETILHLAYERAPLIRSRWDAAGVTPKDIRSLADYSRLVPFITKDDLRAWREKTGDPFGGVLCAEHRELRSITGTSGTTGDPTLLSRPRSEAALDEIRS